MGLYDFFSKTKKKVGETVSSLGATARQYSSKLKDTLNAPAPKVLQNTIGKLPDAYDVAKPAYDFLGGINTRPLSSRASSPLGKLAGGIVETPYTFLTSVPKTYGQTMNEIGSKKIFTPGGVKRTAGRVLESGLDTASMGLLSKGAKLAKAGAKSVAESVVTRQAPKVGNLIREGAKQGMKVGAGYGGAYGGAEALKEEKSAFDAAKDIATGSAAGALLGGAFGGGLPAAGAIAKAVKHDLSKRKAPTDIIPAHKRFQETTVGSVPLAFQNRGVRSFAPESVPKQVQQDIPLVPTTLREVGSAMPRFGMGIEDVSGRLPLVPGNKNTRMANAVNAAKNTAAAEAVAKMPRGARQKAGETPKATPIPKTSARRGNDMESGTPEERFAKSLDEIPTPWGNAESVGNIIKRGGKPPTPRRANALAEYETTVGNRPRVPQPGTIGETFDTFINTKSNKASVTKTAKPIDPTDPLNTLPEGRSEIFRHEPSIANYDTWLSAIGIKKASERKKISFTQAKELIHNWRTANQPEYGGKLAEMGRFKNFVADFQNADTKGVQRGKAYLEQFGATDLGKGALIIRYLDQSGGVPDDIAPAVNALRGEQDALFREAKDAGLDVAYWKDYVSHIWRESPEEVAKKIRNGLKRGIITMDDISKGRASATETPFFGAANSRILKTYEAGERIGLHKLYDDPAQILAHYVRQLERAKAIVRGIAELKKSGAVVEGVQPGMQALTVQGAEGLSAAPELANKVNNAFGQHEYTTFPGKVLETAAAVSRKMKDLLMSGGIPASTINSYGIGMTLKEIGTLSPKRAWNAVTSFLVANNPNASRRFFEENLGQIEKIRNNDIQISTMLDKGGFADTGFVKNVFGDLRGKGFRGGAQTLWDKVVNEPTFGRYLPMSQIKFFNSVESSLLQKGYPAKAAEWMAAKELREGMGLGSAAKEAAKSQVWKDWRETLFFAPTHRMNMIRVFANAFRALGRNPLLPGNQAAAQFLAGGIAVYALYDWTNYKNTGRHLYENPKGKKFEAFIDVGEGKYISVPFMPSVATMPRLGIDVAERLADGDLGDAGGRAWQGTGSILSKPIADVAMNTDYFDRPITNEFDDPSKQWADRAKYLGTQYTAHPYLKTAVAAAEGKPIEQLVAQAVEAPIRFSSEDQLASRQFWDEYNDKKTVYEKFMRLSKSDPALADTFFGENQDDISRYKELDRLRGMYSELKDTGSKDQFGTILKENGFAFAQKPEAGLVNIASAEEGDSQESSDGTWKGRRMYPVAGNIYVPSLISGDKTFKTEILAKIAIEKEDFAQSEETFRDMDNYVLVKNVNGEISAPRKDVWTENFLSKKMTRAKDQENYAEWNRIAEERYKLLTAFIDDPTISPDRKVDYENELFDLVTNYQKFKSYGGAFTKPKKGKQLEEKYRYPLIDKDMLKVQSLLMGGSGSVKPRVSVRPLSLIPVRLPKVRRYRRRRK